MTLSTICIHYNDWQNKYTFLRLLLYATLYRNTCLFFTSIQHVSKDALPFVCRVWVVTFHLGLMDNSQVSHHRDVGKKVKVKFTHVQALRLCTGRTAHRGSRGITLLFLDHGTRRGWGVSVTPRPLFTLGKDPVPIVQEAGCAPGPGWTGAENVTPTGIRTPDRPARSHSLYRLSYRGPHHDVNIN
jgi:hypothetical protein